MNRERIAEVLSRMSSMVDTLQETAGGVDGGLFCGILSVMASRLRKFKVEIEEALNE